MKRLDRALGVLLALRSGRLVSAMELAEKFEVSTRTIYRDVASLAELGIPIYAEMGRAGGMRLLPGYFLPPVMFSVGEAISLLLGLTALRRLRAKPFAIELETAEQKLLAAVPENLRATLAHTQKIVGFEAAPNDVFTQERAPSAPEIDEATEGRTVTIFLQAVLEQNLITMRYRSPYRAEAREYELKPLGLMWDRDRWYLVASRLGAGETPRLWRADRVQALHSKTPKASHAADFDVMQLAGRQWLAEAMAQWMAEAPVKIRLSAPQAERLKHDWYFGHARYEALPSGEMLMTYGADDRQLVFELIRWLGPGAELLEPKAWREELRVSLEQMLAVYQTR